MRAVLKLEVLRAYKDIETRLTNDAEEFHEAIERLLEVRLEMKERQTLKNSAVFADDSTSLLSFFVLLVSQGYFNAPWHQVLLHQYSLIAITWKLREITGNLFCSHVKSCLVRNFSF